MTLNSIMALIFLGGLFTILSLSLLWFWLDYREQKRADWTHMRSRHLHHVVLCAWPCLLAILVVFLRGQGSDVLTWGCVLLTGIFLYSAGLWNLRFERLDVETAKIEVTSTLLARLAYRFPFGEAYIGIVGIGIGVPMLFLRSFPVSRVILLIVAYGLVGTLSFITSRLVGMWNRQRLQQGRSPIYWI